MFSSTNPQDQSRYFATPTEIRRMIYTCTDLIPLAIHILIRKNRLALSTCVKRACDDHTSCSNQRSDYTGAELFVPDCVFARRLRSTWGPHWRCEEQALRMPERVFRASEDEGRIEADRLLLVCKRMFIELTEMLADIATFHISDLDTLRLMLHSQPSLTSSVACFVVSHIKVLHIGMRLPLSTFYDLETASSSAPPDSPTNPMVSAWMNLPEALSCLSSLRVLGIWLDHASPNSWSLVNERAVLAPLLSSPLLDRLSITVSLPKLHPKWESPSKHFMSDISSSHAFRIDRRYRQYQHGIEINDGTLVSTHAPDFPHGIEIINRIEIRVAEWSSEEKEEAKRRMEERERKIWERGEDVWKEHIRALKSRLYPGGCVMSGI